MLPTIHSEPADYEGVGTRSLDRDSTIEDVCDFVVEYINSDVLVRATSGCIEVESLITPPELVGGQAPRHCRWVRSYIETARYSLR